MVMILPGRISNEQKYSPLFVLVDFLNQIAVAGRVSGFPQSMLCVVDIQRRGLAKPERKREREKGLVRPLALSLVGHYKQPN